MQHTVNAQMVNAAEYGVNAKFECNQNAGAMQHIKNACAMQHMAKIECNLYVQFVSSRMRGKLAMR